MSENPILLTAEFVAVSVTVLGIRYGITGDFRQPYSANSQYISLKLTGIVARVVKMSISKRHQNQKGLSE